MMQDHTLLMQMLPLIETRPENWPPPPKVKEYDANNIVKPRHETQDMLRLKTPKGGMIFQGMIRSGLSESTSSLDLHGPVKSFSFNFFDVTAKNSTVTKVGSMATSNIVIQDSKESSGTNRTFEGGTTTIQQHLKKNQTKSESSIKKRVLEESKPIKKGTTKQIPRMNRLVLSEYLRIWDRGSTVQRINQIYKFLEDYTSLGSLDLDFYLSKGGSLIFTRFVVGLQISVQCKKPVAHHFLALGIFIKSLTGERYTYEFALAGGFLTTFEVLRVHEMTNHDKMHAFHFLYNLIDGKGGTNTKRFLCTETSYLECVVDCLTMCQNEHVIAEAKNFLENLCIGNLTKNLVMISKYIVSLLPCDFNPRIQAMACLVLRGIIDQNPEVAASCCTLVVDVLKSDSDDALVDVGNVCIAILGTPTADELLYDLIHAAQPYNLAENLTTPALMRNIGNESNESKTSFKPTETEVIEKEEVPIHDSYFRLQYGAIYVLSYIVKNRIEFGEWMIERGVIGSLLSAIGTPCYTSVQLEAIRLLLLLHELSPHCRLALSSLLPKNFLAVLLTEHEEALQYVTAVMCIVMRRLGTRVQENWSFWFTHRGMKYIPKEGKAEESEKVLDVEEEEKEKEEGPYDILCEIDTLVELVEQSLSNPFMTIVEGMKLISPDPKIIEAYHDRMVSQSQASSRRGIEKFTQGELHIQETEALAPFRKYLHKDNFFVEPEDEFEKYYAAKFIMDSEAQNLDMDSGQVAALQNAELAFKNFKDPLKVVESNTNMDETEEANTGKLSFDIDDNDLEDSIHI